MIHRGPPAFPTLEPRLKSNIAPRHTLGSFVGKMMSAVLMGQDLPPNERLTLSWVEHGMPKYPALEPVRRWAPGTACQNLLTSAVGPPIRVVPVSMAESAVDDVTDIDCPLRVIPGKE